MMAENTTPDMVTERHKGARDWQSKAAVALGELLHLDLPSATWRITDIDQGLTGHIGRGRPDEDGEARGVLQLAALQRWADHFGVEITSQAWDNGQHELEIKFDYRAASVRVWTVLKAVEPEVTGGLA